MDQDNKSGDDEYINKEMPIRNLLPILMFLAGLMAAGQPQAENNGATHVAPMPQNRQRYTR